ncbi:MAG: virulence RhuM family protein [Bdellovibrionales bacterium]|nr:virulence RhuM family protein [Bdellovibrionales bacterium]
MKKNRQKEVIIYQSKTGKIEFRGDFKKDTIWGNLNQIAELFGVQKAAISKHLHNIYKVKELNKKATVSILETVQIEGKRKIKRKIEYYNLDVILSVGYRVNSKQATQFRIWATKTLKQHLLEGYTINKKQLAKNYQKFQKTLENIKVLLPKDKSIDARNTVELIS